MLLSQLLALVAFSGIGDSSVLVNSSEPRAATDTLAIRTPANESLVPILQYDYTSKTFLNKTVSDSAFKWTQDTKYFGG